MDIQQLQIAALDLTENESNILITQMMLTFEWAVNEINDEIDAYYLQYLSGIPEKEYYAVMLKHARLEKLLEYAQSRYNFYAEQINQSIIDTSRVSLANNWFRAQYINAFAFDTKFSVIDPKIIEVSVLGTKKSWQAINDKLQGEYMETGKMAPEYGSLIESILDPFRRDVLVKVQQTVTQGLIQGKSNVFIGAGIKSLMNNSKYQAERIARTESARTANEAIQLASIDARNQGANIKRQWISSHDNRVRASHARMDGKLAEVDKPFDNGVMRPGAWPLVKDNVHERCRTIEVPVDDSGEVNLPRFRRGYPPVIDPKTGTRTSLPGQSEVYSMRYFEQWSKENKLKVNKYGEMYVFE